MRFLLKNLVPVYLFEEKEVESGYVGTEVKDVYTKTAKGIVQPSVSTITAKEYGERAEYMMEIFLQSEETVSDKNKLSFTSHEKPDYKIISIKHYSKHIRILAEVMA